MSDYQTLEINIQMQRVYFRIEGSDYDATPDFSKKSLTRLLALRGSDAQEYGSKLREMTFRDNALEGWLHLRRSINEQKRYRLRLNIDPKAPALHDLWWECLYDKPRCMSRSLVTPLSRYLNLSQSRLPSDKPKLRILLVISNPIDLADEHGKWGHLPHIKEDEEEQVVREALSGMEDRIEELQVLTKPASLVRIWSLLKDRSYDILHIIAHGGFDGKRGTLLLENQRDETADPVDDAKLIELVQDFNSLQLVILAACHSAERSDANAFLGLAPSIVQAGVPAVIAMQDRVTMASARSFTQEFYNALLHSEQTFGMADGAINSARQKLYFEDSASWEWAIPVLFMRGDGQLLSAASAARPNQPTSFISMPSVGAPANLPPTARTSINLPGLAAAGQSLPAQQPGGLASGQAVVVAQGFYQNLLQGKGGVDVRNLANLESGAAKDFASPSR